MLNLGCDCEVCFLNTRELELSNNMIDQKNYLKLSFGLFKGFD